MHNWHLGQEVNKWVMYLDVAHTRQLPVIPNEQYLIRSGR